MPWTRSRPRVGSGSRTSWGGAPLPGGARGGGGVPAAELIGAAQKNQATTIVVGGRSHGVVGGLVLGSVAQKLVRHSPISVLVVRDGQAHRLDTTASGTPSTGTG